MVMVLWVTVVSIWLLSYINACPTGCQCTPAGLGKRAFCPGGSLNEIVASLTKDIHQLHITRASNLQILQQADVNTLTEFPISKLYLTECSIREIRSSVFSNFNFLLDLKFSDNNINVIADDAFSGLSDLKRLDLSRNRISGLGSRLKSLTRLEYLDLSNNLLNSVDSGSFLSLANLVSLKLDGNLLGSIDGGTFEGLRNLEVLSLRRCDLRSISGNLFNAVPRLFSLDLSDNELTNLPNAEDLVKLRSLRNLFLDNNELTVIPDAQFNGMELRRLSLSSNRIQRLSVQSFQGLIVQNLDLSTNTIYDVESTCLSFTAQNLEKINLAGNPIRHLPGPLFHQLYRLNYLNLSDCALEELTQNQFCGLNNLKVLDLSMNRLTNLNFHCFDLNRLQTLKIQNNPWHCDCHIKSLRSWLQDKKSTSVLYCDQKSYRESCKSIRCSSPSSFYNRQVLGLSVDDIEHCPEKETSDSLSVNTQIAIVVPCIIVSIILLIVAVCLWRRGRTREELRKVCVPVEQESSHLDFEKKPKPFENSEIRSLNESDRSFVFRNYFQTMVTNPSRLSYPTISQRDVDSVYSSQPSLYSSCSKVHQQTVGIESTV